MCTAGVESGSGEHFGVEGSSGELLRWELCRREQVWRACLESSCAEHPGVESTLVWRSLWGGEQVWRALWYGDHSGVESIVLLPMSTTCHCIS